MVSLSLSIQCIRYNLFVGELNKFDPYKFLGIKHNKSKPKIKPAKRKRPSSTKASIKVDWAFLYGKRPPKKVKPKPKPRVPSPEEIEAQEKQKEYDRM